MTNPSPAPLAAAATSEALAREIARILCEEESADYRLARLKACARLGLSPRTALPDGARVQAAVIAHQRLFGGRAYAERLCALRRVAVRAMRLLAPFEPRLVGAVASGAITQAHRVQLHAFADAPEALDMFLHDRGIRFAPDDRSYRYPDGREESVPLVRFEAGAIGVDVAVFDCGALRRAPLSPSDGLPMKRLDLAAAEALARLDVEAILAASAAPQRAVSGL
jgi:hypothetical protein